MQFYRHDILNTVTCRLLNWLPLEVFTQIPCSYETYTNRCLLNYTQTVQKLRSLSFARKIGGQIRRQRPNYLMFVDPCIIVQFIKKNPTRCNNVSKFYYLIFIWSSTCFGRHTAHHQEPKSALAASGFAYVEGCWTCSWWTLSGRVCLTTSTNYTSNNLLRMKNQRLPVQF